MVTNHSPTVRRRRLATELKRLRESAQYTCEEVAGLIECSPSKISRMENCKVSIHPRDVRDLLDVYQVSDIERNMLLGLAREARLRGWWQTFGAAAKEGYGTYIGLESDACSMRNFEPTLVPGLLQTTGYTWAVVTASRLQTSREDHERRVEVRRYRQKSLDRDDPLEVWAILDEAVLHRNVGGPGVLREQLDHLVEMAGRPNITLQILPFTNGAHPCMDGSIAILEFADKAYPDIVYVEHMAGCNFVEDEEEVRGYTLVFDHLRAAALGPDESVEKIKEAAETG